jgi:hypothetical protein
MYCPNCGSKNQAEIKFCTRCGTNLATVSEALSGKAATQPPIDERKLKLLKDYYSSRRAAFIGAPMFVIGVIWLAGFLFAGLAEHLAPLLLLPLAMAVYGAICTFWGIGTWVDTTSEMKALGFSVPDKELPRPTQAQLTAPDKAVELTAGDYATDPIRFPGSVTEKTTRQLEQITHQTDPDSRSKQTSQ